MYASFGKKIENWLKRMIDPFIKFADIEKIFGIEISDSFID